MSKIIKADSSFLMMIDIQERLIAAVFNKDEVIKNSQCLLHSARELSLPLIVTEQYPKGIGSTIPELKNLIPQNTDIISKLTFSCCDTPQFGNAFLNLKFNGATSIDTAILFGVESHICVLSTAMSLIEKYGLNVVIAADACGSRTEKNHLLALEAARSIGCFVVPAETIIYQMLGEAGTPQFKALLPLFK